MSLEGLGIGKWWVWGVRGEGGRGGLNANFIDMLFRSFAADNKICNFNDAGSAVSRRQ